MHGNSEENLDVNTEAETVKRGNTAYELITDVSLNISRVKDPRSAFNKHGISKESRAPSASLTFCAQVSLVKNNFEKTCQGTSLLVWTTLYYQKW